MSDFISSRIKASIPREVPQRSQSPAWHAYLPKVRALKAKACLNLGQGDRWLGPWYAKVFAGFELETKKSTKVCLNINGDEKGLILDEYHEPLATIKGLVFDTWTEHAEPKSVIIRNRTPLLKTDYAKTWFYFWKKSETLFMNPLKQFGDKIPYCYRIRDRRRLSGDEFKFLNVLGKIGDGDVEQLPILGEMVHTGKVPSRIGYKELAFLAHAWATTWAQIKKPETLEEKIARQVTDVLGQSITGFEGSLRMLPDTFAIPGVFVKFKNTDPEELSYVLSKGWPHRPDESFMITSKFSTGSRGQFPYKFDLDSQVQLDRLLIDGIADFNNVAGDLSARIAIDGDGVEATLRLFALSAHLSPLGHGGQDRETPPAISTTGGYVYSGPSREGLPSGIEIRLKKGGEITATTNLIVRHELLTPKDEFTIRGDIFASAGAQATLGKTPRVKVGSAQIEIDNLRIFKKGSDLPLVSKARLIISDNPVEKKILRTAHPNFQFSGPGFLVRLELENLEGLGYRKGYLVGFLAMPVDSSERYYDPARFSLQHTLNLAFGLVAKDAGTEYKGEINVSRLDSLADGKKTVEGKGISVAGDVVRISKNTIEHLLKNGRMKIVTRIGRDQSGNPTREVLALINADILRLKQGTFRSPYLSAKASISNDSPSIGLNVDRLSMGFNSFANGKLMTQSVNLMLGGLFSYNRSASAFGTRNLRGSFSLLRVSPYGITRASKGRLSSFDMDGYIMGNWQHNLRTNRGSGFLVLRGDKEGDVHLRDAFGRRMGSSELGRETPLLSDTRWIVLSTNGVDNTGSLVGQFCLRTDIDMLALGAFGVRHADYIEWTMAHDHMPLSITGFMNRAEMYYTDMKRGLKPPKGSMGPRRDICARVLNKL